MNSIDGNSTSESQGQKNVAFDEEATQQTSTSISTPSHRQWLNRFHHQRTILNNEAVESRAFRHDAIFRRPQAMQYYHPDHRPSPASTEQILSRPNSNNSGSSGEDREQRSTDNLLKQLVRTELFIDLIWVGIIANLSATFSEQAFTDTGVTLGQATSEFILVFLPIWRIWDYLREYGTSFYKDDMFQRLFMVWILVLSVLYGINAPYVYQPEEDWNSLKLYIAIYLIARASFLVVNIFHCFWSPFLWRVTLLQALGTVLVGALWIAAIFVPYPGKLGFLIATVVLEPALGIVLESPIGKKLVTGEWKRELDIDHYIERHEGFLIIIIGEGVFHLIDESPSGFGLNSSTGTVLVALLMYYILHWLYFNGDHTKEFVHAMRGTWWRPVLWKLFHIVMYGALLTLAASVLFLVRHQNVFAALPNPDTDTETDTAAQNSKFALLALWSSSVSLAVVLFAMTNIALLNRPLDKPKTLVVNSRILRLLPRVAVIAVILCLPLVRYLTGAEWCGLVTTVLYVLFLWEWMARLEKGWKVFEKKEEREMVERRSSS